MARKSATDAVSLFPFLSILCCIIGVLTLVLTCFALAQVSDQPDEAAIARTSEFHELSRQTVAIREELDRLRGELSKSESSQAAALASAQLERSKREQLQQKAEASRAEEARRLANLQSEIVLLEQEIAGNQQVLDNRQREIAELEKKLEAAPDRESATVAVLAGGSGLRINPTFVECAKDSIVIHAGGEPRRVLAAALEQNAEFAALLDETRARANGTMVFLIRADGIATYRLASQLAVDHGCPNGKLPIVGQGRIDLRRFRRGA